MRPFTYERAADAKAAVKAAVETPNAKFLGGTPRRTFQLEVSAGGGRGGYVYG